MTIDNFNIVSPWFDNLSDRGDFFFVQVMQRDKENNNVRSGSYVIKDYHFFDKETFLAKKEEITTLCKAFNARAYFWVNPRNCKEVQYEIIKETLEAIELINYLNVYLKLLEEKDVISINQNGYQILILRIGIL